MMTEAQGQAIATAVNRCRPDWDHPGIVAALHKARDLGAPAAIAAALFRLAENYEVRTPALLAEPGRHWQGTTVASRIPPVMCPHHPEHKASRCDFDGPCAAQVSSTDHAAGAAAVRAALPRRQVHHVHPEPPVTDLDPVRDRIDEEQS